MLEHVAFWANHVVFSLSHEEVPSRMVPLAVPLHVAVKKGKYHRRRDGPVLLIVLEGIARKWFAQWSEH